MKRTVNMSRLTNQLEKLFRALNADFFDNELEMPIITIYPSSRSYGHYTPFNAWQVGDGGKREINIASGTLNRPLEATICTLVHEMVHMYNDTILHIQDCSRCGTYHNKQFAKTCSEHGLICKRTDKHGWALTEPSDELIMWILEHTEFAEIEMCRNEIGYTSVGIGARTTDGNSLITTTTKSNSRRYICPCCHSIVRATKTVNIICGDCYKIMLEG